MKKYLRVLKISFMEYFVYRLNFFLWRFRSIISFLTLIFFWQAVYGARNEVFGYQKAQMLTYVVGIAVLRDVILGGRVADLAGMIKSGELINKYLLRPWNVITTWFFRDLASKILNLGFVVIEIFLLINIIGLPFYTPQKLLTIPLFLLSCFLAIPLNFLISYFLSIIAFWTDNIWAPRWLFGVIFLEFMAGTFFPLDVLPKFIFDLIHFTPFPYLVYLPLNIYLEKLPLATVCWQLIVLFVWMLLFIKIATLTWKKGLKIYTAYGD